MKNVNNNKKLGLAVLLFAALVLTATAQQSQAETQIWTTDIDGNPVLDYAPTDTVYIQGTGFNMATTIEVSVVGPDGWLEAENGVTDMEVFYSNDENFPYATWKFVGSDGFEIAYYKGWCSGEFYVHVQDEAGNSAETMFTDSELVSVEVVSGTPNAVIEVQQGQTVSFTINLSATGQLRNECTPSNPSRARIRTEYSVLGATGSSATYSSWYDFWSKGVASDKDDVRWAGYSTPYAISATAYAAATATLGDYIIGIAAETTNPVSTPPGHTLRDETSDTLTIRVVAAPPSPTDTTPPVITPNVSGTLGNNGWYISDVTVSWTVTDPESDITSKTGADSITINYDTAGVTLTCTATSAGGTNSQSITIKRDATAPTISASATADGSPYTAGTWTKHNVTVSFIAGDAMSGVASVTAPVTLSSEGSGQSVTGTATDNAGNTASTSFNPVNIDKTAPVITITTPTSGAVYLLNQVVNASWSVTDALSGVATTTATKEPGEAIDTTTIGEKSFTVNATDNAGNTNSMTVHYKVQYQWGGFLPPINLDGSSVFKLKSTIPVKFQVSDANGDPVSTATARIFVQQISGVSPGGISEAVSTAAATTGNLFRYDLTDEQYIFNLGTKTLSTGSWLIIVRLDDGTEYVIGIGLR